MLSAGKHSACGPSGRGSAVVGLSYVAVACGVSVRVSAHGCNGLASEVLQQLDLAQGALG